MLGAVPSSEGGGAAPVGTISSNAGPGNSGRYVIGSSYDGESRLGAENKSYTNGNGTDRGAGLHMGREEIGFPEGGGARSSGARHGGGRDNGNTGGDKSKAQDGEEGEHKEAQQPPKEDPMVDFTDEFGRVRTMRQRYSLTSF